MTEEKIKKNDFIEIEFTGSFDGRVFDTTKPEKAKEMGVDSKNIKPMIVSVGNEMLLKGLDEDLIEKEIGKPYEIHLLPEKAFGSRNPKMIRTYPLKSFRDNNINPYPGAVLQLDNMIAKVISVSGGRVMIDFNNPMAGKEVDYSYKIIRKIDDDKEKINALQDFFFKQRFEFDVNGGKIIFKDEKIKPVIDIFSERFKDMTGLEFECKKEERKKIKEEDTQKQ